MTEEFKLRESIPGILYWSLPALLFGVELFLLSLESHQVRYEELAEAVRNPYWFSQRMIYDGISSNVGWYGLLHYSYSILGFSLLSGRTVKAVLFFASLIGLAHIALRHLPRPAAALLVVTLGLSPIYLYFGRMMTSYGTDISYALLWLAMVSLLTWRGGIRDYARTTVAWLFVFLGCSSFPALVFYLPSMGILFAHGLWRNRLELSPIQLAGYVASAAGAFFVPLLAAVRYIETPLLLDPRTNSGLFRGGGQLALGFDSFSAALKTILLDAFVRGDSYYVEIQRPDFAGFAALVALAACAAGVVHGALRRPELRLPLCLAGLLFALALLVPGLAPNYPGIRRATGFVFAIYLGFAFALWHLSTSRNLSPRLRRAGIGCLALLPLSHVAALPSAYDSALADSDYRYSAWFERRESPEASLEYWLDHSARKQSLPCNSKPGAPPRSCRYSEIFGALAGYRLWNDEPAIPIRITNPETGVPLELRPETWENYTLPH